MTRQDQGNPRANPSNTPQPQVQQHTQPTAPPLENYTIKTSTKETHLDGTSTPDRHTPEFVPSPTHNQATEPSPSDATPDNLLPSLPATPVASPHLLHVPPEPKPDQNLIPKPTKTSPATISQIHISSSDDDLIETHTSKTLHQTERTPCTDTSQKLDHT